MWIAVHALNVPLPTLSDGGQRPAAHELDDDELCRAQQSPDDAPVDAPGGYAAKDVAADAVEEDEAGDFDQGHPECDGEVVHHVHAVQVDSNIGQIRWL